MNTLYLERPGGTLAYSDYGGEGPLVLMLPGMGALRSEYRYLAPRLRAAGFRAVTADLRGQGDSSVPWPSYEVPALGGDVVALIEHLDGGAAHLIGTSKAASAAVWAAAERPDCVCSAVLVGAFARDVRINPFMTAAFWVMSHGPWRVRAWTMYYPMLYPTHKPADFQDYLGQLAASLAQPSRFDAVVAVGSAPTRSAEERLGRVRAPTLVILGSKDPDFPDPAAEGKALAELTGGRLEMIAGAGHYPQTEMPEETAATVIDFLTQSAGC